VVKSLFQLKEQGLNPNLALDQSTVNNWTAVYPPRTERPNGAAGLKSFRERDADLASAEVNAWTGGRIGMRKKGDVIDMEATHGRLDSD
jgi:hypothetical protein